MNATVESLGGDPATVGELVAALSESLGWWHAQPRNFTKIEPSWVPEARALLARVKKGGA